MDEEREQAGGNPGIDPVVAGAVLRLRTEVPVRPEWRARVLAAAQAEAGATRGRRWVLPPAVGIAAAVLCVLLGAGSTALIMQNRAPAVPPLGSVAPSISTVRFVLVTPTARTVSVVGDFNGWNPTAVPLRRMADGRTWVAQLPLAPGRYTYAFVVDGTLTRDPAAPESAGDDFGVPNSVLMVRNGAP